MSKNANLFVELTKNTNILRVSGQLRIFGPKRQEGVNFIIRRFKFANYSKKSY